MGKSTPKLVGKGRFSMIKLEVDRTKLTPTIKPFSREADPEEIRKEQAELRQRDKEEAEDLRQLLEDVRGLKAEGVEDWQERMRPAAGATIEDVDAERAGADDALGKDDQQARAK